MERKSIAEKIREIAIPIAEKLSLEIWDVEFVKEGADYILRIIIDKNDVVDINDCENMSRAIDPILDEIDIIENSYKLEVSSPGIERSLTRPEHYIKSIGDKIEIKLYAPLNGRKQIVGILNSYDNNCTEVIENDVSLVIENELIAKVSTVYDW